MRRSARCAWVEQEPSGEQLFVGMLGAGGETVDTRVGERATVTDRPAERYVRDEAVACARVT